MRTLLEALGYEEWDRPQRMAFLYLLIGLDWALLLVPIFVFLWLAR